MAEMDIERIVQKVVKEVLSKKGEQVSPNPLKEELHPPAPLKGGLPTPNPSQEGNSTPAPLRQAQDKPLGREINEKDTVKRVAIGADHGGFEAKEMLKTYLQSIGYQVTDVGTYSKESVDYPDYAAAVARKVASGACERGIMIDGAGIGSSMVCNKVRGIRAALCYDMKTIINSREHNNANVLTLGGPLHASAEICEMAKVWLETRFAGGRHWPRINKMMAIERKERHYGSEGTD